MRKSAPIAGLCTASSGTRGSDLIFSAHRGWKLPRPATKLRPRYLIHEVALCPVSRIIISGGAALFGTTLFSRKFPGGKEHAAKSRARTGIDLPYRNLR